MFAFNSRLDAERFELINVRTYIYQLCICFVNFACILFLRATNIAVGICKYVASFYTLAFIFSMTKFVCKLFQNTVLPEAVHFWEQALFVRRVQDVIRLTR